MVHKGSGIFLVYVDIDATHDQEFNEWYTTEHLPELQAVPGILAAARYVAVKGGPKYLAFYELEDIDVLHTPAFTNRPQTPNPAQGSRKAGKSTTSRMALRPLRSITRRSMPIPMPPVGGIPCSSARTNPSS